MGDLMMEVTRRIFTMELVLICGQKARNNILAVGLMANLRDKGYLHGQMEGNILGNIREIRNTDMEFSNMQMELVMLVIGLEENSTEKVFMKIV